MIFISNYNELDYYVSFIPNAPSTDDLLDVLVISKISKFIVLLFEVLVLLKAPCSLKEVRSIQTRNIQPIRTKGDIFQPQIGCEPYPI